MALVETTPLLTTIAEVVEQRYVLDLANLTADSELVIADALLRAHQTIFRWVQQLVDPALITNQDQLKKAEAIQFVLDLTRANLLPSPDGKEAEIRMVEKELNDELRRFTPQLSEGPEGRGLNEAVPSVGSFEPGWVFGPPAHLPNPSQQQFIDDFPRDPR